MKGFLPALCFATLLAACASYDGRGLVTGASTAADVERAMGAPAEKRQVGGETWFYYPRQPYCRQVFVARIGADGRLAALEPRLTDETLARIVPGKTRGEEVRDLLGPPWQETRYARLNRDIWTWYAYRWNNPGMPAQLHVQLSPEGTVREVYLIDDYKSDRDSIGFAGFGFR